MTTESGQATARDRIEPVVEALLKELIETASYPKAVSGVQAGITAAMTDAFIASLIFPERSISQESFETAVLVAALAPALAEALAPALAQALTPAIEEALRKIVSPKKTGQEAAHEGDSDKQGQG